MIIRSLILTAIASLALAACSVRDEPTIVKETVDAAVTQTLAASTSVSPPAGYIVPRSCSWPGINRGPCGPDRIIQFDDLLFAGRYDEVIEHVDSLAQEGRACPEAALYLGVALLASTHDAHSASACLALAEDHIKQLNSVNPLAEQFLLWRAQAITYGILADDWGRPEYLQMANDYYDLATDFAGPDHSSSLEREFLDRRWDNGIEFQFPY